MPVRQADGHEAPKPLPATRRYNGYVRILRDLLNLHVGKTGAHRWTKWRDRTWCTYCGKES